MTYIITNLDFEMQWARSGEDPPKVVNELARRWGSILRLVEPEAEVLSVAATDELFKGVERGRKIIAWGWTPRVVERAKAAGLVVDAPAMEVVGCVNHKGFSHRLEREQGWGMPGACWIEDGEQFTRAMSAMEGAWVLKDPWGVSGRGQRRGGDGEAVSAGLRRWVERVISAGGGVVLEPRLEVEREMSLHFDVDPKGEVRPVGVCGLIAGRGGTLRGLTVREERSIPRRIEEGAWRAAGEVAAQGYFGPLGIDAMVGRLKGEVVERAVTEINARWTFGRMALLLWQCLSNRPPGAELRWHFPSRKEGAKQGVRPWPSTWQQGSYVLPEAVDPGGESGSYVELGSS